MEALLEEDSTLSLFTECTSLKQNWLLQNIQVSDATSGVIT